MVENLNDVADFVVVEDVPSLEDFAEEASGAWPNGWYGAQVIEGYSTPKGKVFITEDGVSKNGDSRNLRLCLKVKNAKGEERNLQESFNYRPTDFTPERLAFIKELRQEYKGVRGRWSDADAQRTSLALAKIGQIEKALGFAIRSTEGFSTPAKAIGKELDVRLGVNENGYNEVTGFAAKGSKGKQRA